MKWHGEFQKKQNKSRPLFTFIFKSKIVIPRLEILAYLTKKFWLTAVIQMAFFPFADRYHLPFQVLQKYMKWLLASFGHKTPEGVRAASQLGKGSLVREGKKDTFSKGGPKYKTVCF